MAERLTGRAEVKLAAAAEGVEQPEGTLGYFAGPLLTFDSPNRNGDVVPAGSLPEARGITLGREHNEYIQPVAVLSSYNRNGGVEVEGHWLDTQAGRDAQVEAKARQAAGGVVAISYGIVPDELATLTSAEIKAGMKRKLKAGELVDVSLVQYPAVAEARLMQVASGDGDALAALEARVAALEAAAKAEPVPGSLAESERAATLDEREAALDAREAALRASISKATDAVSNRAGRKPKAGKPKESSDV